MTQKEAWKLAQPSTEILRVTPEGEFIWHENADRLIDEGDFTNSPSTQHILRALRKPLTQPEQEPTNDWSEWRGMVVQNLMRHGIDKDFARRLAHFYQDKAPQPKEPEQDDEVLGFNGWGFPIEKPNKALIEKTADHDVDCLCIDCAMVDEQDDVPWTDKAFERLCENMNNMTSAEFAIVQRFIFGVYAHSPQPKEPEKEPNDLTIAYMAGLSRGKDLAPQRKPLTYEEIWSSNEIMAVNGTIALPMSKLVAVVRAVEASHNIKE